MKTTISIKEVILRLLIITAVFVLAFISKDSEKQVISTVGFFVAFVASIYLHKHFFPFLILAILCYLMASLQELWNENYIYLDITKDLWTAGNIFLPIGVVNFAYKLIFKYKIVDHEQ
ncbi:MAG: hypothetical protein RSE50_00885 [Myroides sp.]